MDPAMVDLIKYVIGGAAVLLSKGVYDGIRIMREGRSLKEAGLVTTLTSAVERSERMLTEADERHAREMTAKNEALLLTQDERDYWRNRNGVLEYLLSQEKIPFEPANPDLARRKT